MAATDRPDSPNCAVFILWHIRKIGEAEDFKLLGVYSTSIAAKRAMRRFREKPGFSLFPKGFHIDRYVLDRDCWSEGFTVT